MKIFEITLFGFNFGPTYYGLMYVIWFVWGYYIIKYRKTLSEKLLDNLLIYIFLWVILGGRLGYVIFYNPSYYLSNIIEIIKFWEWGMSFHGGVIGVVVAMFVFARVYKLSFLKIADEITSILPIWLWAGRIWNYLNKELLWFQYTWPLAVEKWWVYYFPSPLLEAFLEWLVLFIILFFVYRYKKYPGQVAACFLLFYGIFRVWVELFVRTPDESIWYIWGFMTMWSILSIPMILVWLVFLLKGRGNK